MQSCLRWNKDLFDAGVADWKDEPKQVPQSGLPAHDQGHQPPTRVKFLGAIKKPRLSPQILCGGHSSKRTAEPPNPWPNSREAGDGSSLVSEKKTTKLAGNVGVHIASRSMHAYNIYIVRSYYVWHCHGQNVCINFKWTKFHGTCVLCHLFTNLSMAHFLATSALALAH